MGSLDRLGRVAAVCSLALVAAACTASPGPSASVGPPGILLVEPGEKVQAGPSTEELKVVMSNALVLAENNGADLGYPWFDVTTGELVLSAVTPRGRDLIAAAGITARYRVRVVAHGAGVLQRIQDDATFLRTQGVPGAELIYQTVPDWRDNRAMIVISASSQPLLDALTARYPADALAVQVNPAGAPRQTPASPTKARVAAGPGRTKAGASG
jgi:hypothetical protein